MTEIETILWRNLLFPGHEACRLFSQDELWHLAGTAVFLHKALPCRLDYRIVCDAGWRTLSAKVEGWVGDAVVDVQIRTDAAQRWWLNEVEQPAVMGCIDLDLNFSPSTNLLPIRRLDLTVGEAAEMRAAWLRFPSFALEVLPQRYRRLSAGAYRYESGEGRFVAELKVNPAGFVVEYGDIWEAEVPPPA